MKTLIVFAVTLLLCITQSYAQDTIMLRNGEELIVKIVQVNESVLSYSSLQSTDTALTTIPVSNVFMIKYSKGTKQVFGNTSIASDYVDALVDGKIKKMQAESDYARYSKLYDKKRRIGIGCTAAGGTLLLVGIPLAIVGDLSDGYMDGGGNGIMAAGSLCAAAGLAITIVGAINLAVVPRYKKKRDAAAGLLSFYPATQPIPPAWNVYGSYTGLAMRVTF